VSRPGVTSPTPEAHGSLGSFTPSAAQSRGRRGENIGNRRRSKAGSRETGRNLMRSLPKKDGTQTVPRLTPDARERD